ncbi:MAG: GspH/FimT family pseudopilin [Holophagae bacterium]
MTESGVRFDGPRQSRSGHSVIEAVTALAVLGTIMIIGAPALDDARCGAALDRATAQIHGLLVRSRAVAVLRGRACAVVFDRAADGSWSCFVAEDGDGDGVRRTDIGSGRDPITGVVVRLEAGAAGPCILTGGTVPDPAGRGALGGDPADPIRAGRGDIITFSPHGTATPSSIYLCDSRRRMIVLRVYGGTGRINTLAWRFGLDGWQQR